MGLLNTILTATANKRNRRATKEMNEQNIQFQREVNTENIENQWKMWNASNEYNHPAAQMARYAEAGLNPNLIYGQSNTTSPVDVGKSQAPKVTAFQQQANQLSLASGFLDNIQKMQNIRAQHISNEFDQRTLEDRVRNIGLENDKIVNTINHVNAQISKIGVEKTSIEINNDINNYYKEHIMPLEKKLKDNEVTLSNNDIQTMEFRNRILEANAKLNEFRLHLDQMDYLLGAQNFDLNEEKIKEIQQSIEESKKRIDKMQSDINYTSHLKKMNVWHNANETLGKIFQPINTNDLLGIGKNNLNKGFKTVYHVIRNFK